MVYIETYYDYEIDKECFKVCEEKGYTKSTDVILNPVTLTTTSIDNAVQTFTVDVVGDRGNSSVAFYDNDTLIPVTINGNEQNFIEWTNNTTVKTVSLNLNYGVEHNITAKYLGNNKCSGSTSKKIHLFIDYPPAYASTITLTPSVTSKVYLKNQNVVINGTLKDKNNTNLGSKTIKIYVDGNLASTTSTNSSGAFTYTGDNLTSGKHTIKAVFEGTVQYTSANSSVEVSKGYEIKAETDRFWINGKGNVYATVNDYFGNPIPNLSVSCTLKSGTSISATTNNRGKATLSRTTNLTGLNSTSTVTTTYGDASNSFNIVYVAPFTFNVTGEQFTTVGNSTELTLTAQSQVNLKGLSLHLFGDNVVPSVVYLDNSNQAKFHYNGTGLGDVTINVSDTTDISQDITITDYLQYWKSGSTSSYEKYKTLMGNILALSNGWKIEAPASDGTTFPFAVIGLGDGNSFDEDWSLEFTVINADNYNFDVGIWSNNTGINSIESRTFKLKRDDVILTTKVGNVMTIKQNGTSKVSKEVSDGYPAIAIASINPVDPVVGGNVSQTITSKVGYATIDNVKFKVI